MLKKILYENTIQNFLFLFILIIFLPALHIFINKTINNNTYIFIYGNLNLPINQTLFFIIFTVFTSISAFLLYYFNYNFNETFSRILPSFSFIILINYLPINHIKPINFLILPILIELINILFNAYNQEKVYKYLFNFSFLTSISSFINFNFIFIILTLYLWLILFRTYNIREYILPLVGLIIPYLIIDTVTFIFSGQTNFFSILFNRINFNGDYHPEFSIIILFLIFIFLIYNFLKFRHHLKKVKNRKYNTWIIFSTALLWILYFILHEQIIVLSIIVFMSFLLTINLTIFEKPFFSKLFFISLLLLNLVVFLFNI